MGGHCLSGIEDSEEMARLARLSFGEAAAEFAAVMRDHAASDEEPDRARFWGEVLMRLSQQRMH